MIFVNNLTLRINFDVMADMTVIIATTVFIYNKKLKLNFDVMAVMAAMAVTTDFHSLPMFVYCKEHKLNLMLWWLWQLW